MKKILVLILSTLITYSISSTQVTIHSPLSLTQKINEEYPAYNLSIPNALGNFGDVPYGRSIIGYLVLHKNTDGSNYWCDPQKLNRPYLQLTPGQVPIFLVDHSTDCPYSKKAYNVRQMGGSMMILISDNNDLMDEYNSDNEFGFVPDIPTIIIPRNIGEIFIDTISTQTSFDHKIILTVKFNAIKDNSNLHLELFFRSDDIKALGFFREFATYAERLKEKLTFVPVYKYNKYNYVPDPDSKDPQNSINPCVKGYCTGKNDELQISNPRLVLMENIRQSCIYSISQEAYWNYMMTFFELCADLYTPTFTTTCAENTLKTIGLYSELKDIEKCMSIMMNEANTNTKIEQDYELFEKKKVYRVPELIINGIKYRGSWHGRYIFTAICNGFIDDEEICRAKTLEETNSSFFNVKIFFTFIVIIVIFMIILLICYRRIVDKAINTDYNEMVQQQTIFSIEQNRYKSNQVKSENA